MSFMGRKVRDKITGFTGIVTGHADYLSGCDQYLVSPSVKKDNECSDARWFDEQRIEVLSKTAICLDNSKGNGADKPAPIK